MTCTNQQRCYDVTVRIILNRTDRSVTEEFVGTQSVTRIAYATIGIVYSVVTPDQRAAYCRGRTLVSAILAAAGLPSQYRITNVSVQEAHE